MKKVVKVSIGNLAFVVEEDAYSAIKRYLDDISDHYYAKENGSEIIEGIEERMAELLSDRTGVDHIVSVSDVKEVISILGRPDDFEETGFQEPVKVTKRLYRDGEHKVLGGVCSGLAAYLNIDVVLIRIAVALIFILTSFHWGKLPIVTADARVWGGGFMFLAYIALWIIIPKAKTMEERYAMYGETLDLSNIQDSIKRGARHINKGVRSIGREAPEAVGAIVNVFARILGFAFTIIAMAGLIILPFLLLGVEIFRDIFLFEVLDYIEIGGCNPLYLKIALTIIILLPFVGMLYTGLQLLFGFKSPKWRPGLVIFLLWLLSIILFSLFSIKASRPYWGDSVSQEELVLNDSLSTLYINLTTTNSLPQSKVFFDADRYGLNLFWVDGTRHNREVVVYPRIRIVRLSDDSSQKRMEILVNTVSYNYAEAYFKAQTSMPVFSLTDSLLAVSPQVYTKNNKWGGTRSQITLYLPKQMKVQVVSPVQHDFSNSVRWH